MATNSITSPKIDSSLEMALSLSPPERAILREQLAGYDDLTNLWRLIVLYNGDINAAAEKFNAEAEILSETYAIVTISEPLIIPFSNETEVVYIEKPLKLTYMMDLALRESCVQSVNNFPQYGLMGNGVLIGIIDSGIDYMHPDFIRDDGTSRILYIWDQSLNNGGPPEGFSKGVEFTNQQINDAIATGATETALLTVPHYDYAGHGTSVAGIAAGNGRASNGYYRGVAPMSSLIIVKLGAPDFQGYPINTVDIMLGMKYLIEKAKALDMPIAINLSYGSNIGPHDGSSLFETYVQQMSIRWKTCVIVAAGNEADKARHKSGNVRDNEKITIVVKGDTPRIIIDIWKPQVDFVNIEIINPRGSTTGIISYQTINFHYNFGYENVRVIFSSAIPFNTKENIYIEIISNSGIISKGSWILKFHVTTVLRGRYDMWLSSTGDSAEFSNPVIDNTVTIPSTVESVITVGSYSQLTGILSPFSGRGEPFNLDYIKPDLVSPGIEVMASVPGGSYSRQTGTSISAPIVTGCSALVMEWGIINGNNQYMYGQNAKMYLCAGAKRGALEVYPNNSWGYGKLCILSAMELMLGIIDIDSETVSISEFREQLPQTASETEEKVASNSYIGIVASYDNKFVEAVNEYPDQVIPAFLFSYNNIIVYIHDAIAENIFQRINVVSNISYPLAIGLNDVEAIEDSKILPIQTNPNIGLFGGGVLICVMGSGIDYTHSAFRYEDGTSKIVYLWDQTILTGNPPEGFLFGTEYTKEQIDEALRAENPLDIVPSVDLIGHDTFTTGVACGRGDLQQRGVAPDAEIIFVKIAPAKPYAKENNMLFNEDFIVYSDINYIQGFYYITERARKLGRPFVIVETFGSSQGSHDGINYFPVLGSNTGFAVISAGGNEGNARNHAMGKISDTNDTEDIELRIGEGEMGISIYIWNYYPDKVSISISTPSGEYIEKLSSQNIQSQEVDLIFYDSSIWINYFMSVDRNGDQLTAIRIRNPEPGTWRITVYGDYILNGVYHAWLPLKQWTAENTFFINSDSDYTITEPANNSNVICVGAYSHIDQNMYIDSSRGPSRSGIIRPDIVAPGVDILGPLPGNTYGRRSGTSIAAAHVAGAAALLMEWGIIRGNYPNINGQTIKALFAAGAQRGRGLSYPNNLTGYGQLDLLNTFMEMNTVPTANPAFTGKDYLINIQSTTDQQKAPIWHRHRSGKYFIELRFS